MVWHRPRCGGGRCTHCCADFKAGRGARAAATCAVAAACATCPPAYGSANGRRAAAAAAGTDHWRDRPWWFGGPAVCLAGCQVRAQMLPACSGGDASEKARAQAAAKSAATAARPSGGLVKGQSGNDSQRLPTACGPWARGAAPYARSDGQGSRRGAHIRTDSPPRPWDICQPTEPPCGWTMLYLRCQRGRRSTWWDHGHDTRCHTRPWTAAASDSGHGDDAANGSATPPTAASSTAYSRAIGSTSFSCSPQGSERNRRPGHQPLCALRTPGPAEPAAARPASGGSWPISHLVSHCAHTPAAALVNDGCVGSTRKFAIRRPCCCCSTSRSSIRDVREIRERSLVSL